MVVRQFDEGVAVVWGLVAKAFVGGRSGGTGTFGPALRIACAAIVLGGVVSAGPRFEDAGEALGVDHVYGGGWEYFVGGGVAVFDCDADGLPELAAAGGEGPSRLFVNESRPGLLDFAPRVMPGLTRATGLWPLDLDADGVLDLAVTRVGENRFLKGLGDCRFADRTADWGLGGTARWSTAFSAAWPAGAARPLLAVGNYVDRDDPDGPFGTCDVNRLHRPTESGWHGQDLSPGYCALSILFSKGALGRLGLRLSNDRHYYVSGGREQMWDVGWRRFLGPEDGWPDLSLWGMGIAERDLDGDALPEVMLTSMGDQMLMRAKPDGAYAPAPYGTGTHATRPHTGGDGRPSTGWHAEWGDVDLDGRDDLFIAKGNVDQMPGMAMADPNNLLMQTADGTFTEAAAEAGMASPERSRGAALADLDGDGRLDLVVVNRRAPMEIWLNVTETDGHWLAVDLRQAGPNAFALGATVTVETAGRRHWREVTVGGGHGGGKSIPMHFGLGAAERAVVTVTWPDGSRSPAFDLAADRTIRIERDSGARRTPP